MPKLKLDSLSDSLTSRPLEINYELSGSGPLLILHHGFGSWGRDWNRGGWLEPLREHATVMIFDAIGHGLSTRSHDPNDHTVEQRAAVVNALADEYGSERYGYVGFSMGGRTGLELAATTPQRLKMIAIGGMHLLPATANADRFIRHMKVLRSGRAKSVEQPDGERPGNDPLALAASHEALLWWQGAGERLQNHHAPTLLFCGEDDAHFPNAKESSQTFGYELTALENTDHDSTFFSSKEAVESVTAFVAKHLA
ncbi:alpha/beta fold hydrolase [Candidatus Lucifugimonas marina]|jgi:pimeloyl-ACP methyl ester carboxylesterase|uniref:Alpha/beta fold hydrolase n=1 Tax=Candidatus Lucifugimonas marina TaxID=3038979 RepID=A0AAJ5ZG07_9CHLR|nr:alpha/beta fold hydrolase [SAR202 cluster bacterium JH702]MDG0869540.1 alpha/beta fold hydrolase [SAR202 cluster bacterium JH639]WFG34277.1 alpha/beta fold hydrolase [SAR202 cluster bacterium JH545]WFG38207.1 alpha/beta fold hydrolase [SAR202 cluster bacterium JH1073]